MTRRPRLVHLTTTEASLALLLGPQLEAFQAAGYEVIGMSAPGPLVADLEARGVRHVPVTHATRAMAPHRDALALAELWRLFRRLRPDIVHTHNPKPGVYGRLAARAAGVPAILNTVHGLYALPDDRFAKRAVVYTLERIASTCSMAELVQNPEDIPVLERIGVPAAKLHLLGNGIDLRRFDPAAVSDGDVDAARRELRIEPGDIVVGLVGRLVAEKGYLEVFDAARSLRAAGVPVRFVVVGPADPDKDDQLGEADVARARADGVTFLGMRTDVEVLYRCFDVYVLASHREGFPRSAMEAAAMGLPVVATDIRGCRQVVDHDRTGILVPARDAAMLTDAIRRLAGRADERVAMGAAARVKAAKEFDQQRVIDTTLAVYDQITDRTRRETRAA